MRLRGARPRGALARGQEHDRLAGRDGGPHEGATVAEVLAVDGDHARRLVVRELGDELGRLQIGLVAERDEPGKTEADLAGEQRELEREVPALRDEPDRAAGERVRRELELRSGVEDTEAIRSEQDRARAAHPLDDGVLTRAAGLAALPEAGRDRDDRAGAGVERCADRFLERRRRHRDGDELLRLGQLCQ